MRQLKSLFKYVNPVIWVDWTMGSSRPFSNSSGTGTVSYVHSFQSVLPISVTPPDSTFPFGNPVEGLFVNQSGDASITFTFSGVSPDSGTIFTLGNLRATNEFVISAFDSSNNPIPLTFWTVLGEFRIYSGDTGPNLWNPSNGLMVGNGNIQNQENSKNLFFGGLTTNIAQIHVDYRNVDNGFEFLHFGIAQTVQVPEPSALLLVCFGVAAILISKSNK
ncbi:MAG: PEP-CTERM sorting domain-containing protein [Microcystis wesenbergii Mw_QC_S_20081001_S30D]|jgi:hypothetical protein|uniref:PEP-CTERM sorting domain-containing protein n=1 Tax=Microcystis wesenbergii Mw_QC_S_20081001_S30D TaxID=2486245 RepID=A0A552JL30_9CHRO|nr:MAG: PEP-CTERM sorting domain-containing protein [Microcystis wesenbergii Mw_QC_B_20070930_S4D]TRU96295.1 MAG: PEP-CTERM sorting domain-containing protein [Microcystis wesenbergii Mw_QC_S_20081001_S30D]TRV04379.1 MAG: PEP-CTERM sorting domain-containing protein [Microcystis wesenbergii Mw_QC_S_20081001_S30]TRV09681.1 MAG: PEP-CTERM sorting domain-containing protein [Microcystis wesenbergii Mw_QC_B_20070930_S4]